MISSPHKGANPFVGPRSYRTGETLYGRDHEVLELLDLVIAERIVLLYSPSGAGKSSLVQAALLPKLGGEAFTVAGVARVTFEADTTSAVGFQNRYVSAVISSIEETLPRDRRLPVDELSRMTLSDYLEQRWSEAAGAGGFVLIVDQFEEILTTDPTDLPAKHSFFAQLGSALRNPNYWALLAMREEHLAGLDPYRRLVPTQLSSAFRLEPLNEEQAREAMQRTAANAGIAFTDTAAQKLVDDLRRVRVQRPDGKFEEQLGPSVEPVQLQVVCYRLWDRLPETQSSIEEADVEALGNVDTALADFYADVVARVAQSTGTSERQVRGWVEDQLITPQGLRNQVLQEDARQLRGLDLRAVTALVNDHLVRAERRRGFAWFELAHDRLIDPIRDDNARWREANLTLFQRQAALWDSQGRPSHLEVRGAILTEAERWAAEQGQVLTAVESDFLDACIQSRRRERADRKKSRTISLLGVSTLGLLLVYGGSEYLKWRTAQQWAYMTDLLNGQVYELKGDTVSIGRAAGAISNKIDVHRQNVSRLQLFISRGGRAVDARSLNGTTINARFLRYGYERQLEDGDLIALAGVALFKFSAARPPLLPFLPSAGPKPLPHPEAGWAVLINGAGRNTVALVEREYFLATREDGKIELSTTRSNRSLLQITKDPNNLVTLTALKNNFTPLATIKYEDREYVYFKLPVNKPTTYRYFKIDGEQKLWLTINDKPLIGAEYASKISLCFSKTETQQEFTIVNEDDPDDTPSCVVGPLQIIERYMG